MRNKIIKNNIIIVIIAIFSLFIVCCLLFQQKANQITEEHLLNYAAIVKVDYNGYNELDVINKMKNVDESIRITFINSEGNIIKDSYKDSEDNHLSRPEIQNLETIQIRYSSTIKTNMMYYAFEEYGNYVRLAIPTSNNAPIFIEFFLIMAIVTITIGVITSYVVRTLTDKSMVPLYKAVNELALLSSDDFPLSKSYDTEVITNDIHKIKQILEDDIKEIKNQKDKIEYIVNNMHQGILVIDSNRNIVLINQFACKLFEYNKDNILNKNLIYLTRNDLITSSIEETLKNNTDKVFDVEIDGSIYSFFLNIIKSDWINISKSGIGAMLLISDVTQIRNLDSSKKEFFANTSHELKSPLTSIIGFLEMIIEGVVVDKDEIIDIAKKSLSEAKRTTTLINEMLLLSKLETIDENGTVEKEQVNLKEIILSTIEGLKPQIDSLNLNVITSLEAVSVLASREHMVTLVRNLLDNAVKYNNVNGNISVSLHKNEDIELTITDTGIGIQKKDQKRIFERFYRVDKARSKKYGGTGLGLAIVKHICVLYDAKIEVKSEINKGSTFNIKLKG